MIADDQDRDALKGPGASIAVPVEIPRAIGLSSTLGSIARTRKRMVSVLLYGAVTVLPQVTSGFLAIVYTRVFSPEEYGNYGILAAMLALVATVVDLGLPSAALRNFYGDERKSARHLASVIYGTRLTMVGMLPVLGIPLYLFWDELGVRFQQAWLFVPALLIIALIDRSAEMLATICRASERATYFAAGRITQSLVMVMAGITLVFVFRLGIGGALLAMLAGEAAEFLVYDTMVIRRQGIFGGRFDLAMMKEYLGFGLPLVPNRLAGWGRLLAVRPVLARVAPLSDVGLYSFASAIATLPNLMSTAVDLAFAPVYYRRREDSDTVEFRTKVLDFTTAYIAGLLPVWVIAIVFCRDFIEFLGGSTYAAAAPVCALLLCASFARMQVPFLQRQIQFLKKTWILSAITIPISVLSVVLTIVLVRRFGIVAAGWSALAGDVGILFCLAWAIRRYEALNYPLLTAVSLIVVLTLLSAWVAMGSPGVGGWQLIGLKAGIVAMIAAMSFAIWIWPRRRLIVQLAAG